MAVSARMVRAAASTGGGTQNFTVSGFGTPKAAIIIASEATTNITAIGNAKMSVGFTDGTRQFSVGVMSEDAIADSDCYHVTSNTRLLAMLDGAGNVEHEGLFNGWITDGLQIDWGASGAFGGLVTVILLGGSDLSVYAGDFLADAAVDTDTDVTAPGFEPDQVIVIGSQNAAYDSVNDTFAIALMMMGFADNGTSDVECGASYHSIDSSASANCANYVSDVYTIGDTDHNPAVEIRDFDASGFTATTRNSGGAYRYCYLALKYGGAPHWAGIIDSPTATGVTAVTTPGIQPQFVMVLSQGVNTLNTQITSDIVGATGTYGIAAFNSSEIFSTCISDDDAAATMNTESFSADSFRCRDSIGAHLHRATFVSLDATGWTLDYDIASTTARRWPTMCFGQTASSGPVIPVFMHGYRQRRV